jgi:hypothetical protein
MMRLDLANLKFFMYIPSMNKEWWEQFSRSSSLVQGFLDLRFMPCTESRMAASASRKYLRNIFFTSEDWYLFPQPLAILREDLLEDCISLIAGKLEGHAFPDEEPVWRTIREPWNESYLTYQLETSYDANDYGLALLFPIFRKEEVLEHDLWDVFYGNSFNPVTLEMAHFKERCSSVRSFKYRTITDLFNYLQEESLPLPGWRSNRDADGTVEDLSGEDEDLSAGEEGDLEEDEENEQDPDYWSSDDPEDMPELTALERQQRGILLTEMSGNMKRKLSEADRMEMERKRSRRYSDLQQEKCATYNARCRYTPLDMEDWCEHPRTRYWGLEKDEKCFDLEELMEHFEKSCLGVTMNGNPFPRYPFDPWTRKPFSLADLEEIANTVADAGFLKPYVKFRMFLQWSKDNGVDKTGQDVDDMDFTPEERKRFTKMIVKTTGGGKHVRFRTVL